MLGWSPRRIDFILRTLDVLQDDLAKLGVPFEAVAIKEGDFVKEAVNAIAAIAARIGSNSVFFNCHLGQTHQEQIVEQAILRQLSRTIGLREFEDSQCVVPPGQVMIASQRDGVAKPYCVFTPFSKRWHAVIAERLDKKGAPDGGWTMQPLNPPTTRKPLKASLPLSIKTGNRIDTSSDWPAGEAAAKARLDNYLRSSISDYHELRNRPSETDSSSRMSAYQAIGAISMKHCFRAASAMPASKGRDAWINELAWRDFYRHIWFHYEHVRRGVSFKPEADRIVWNVTLLSGDGSASYEKHAGNTHHLEDLRCDVDAKSEDCLDAFRAWQAGQTGFPIIDAGMRQLAVTGFLPNRLRMLVASFLTKDLLVDWRLGERHFRAHLIDLDEPSNNGGWQWAASTGTDSQPYFRIFSPQLQAERYDPKAVYTKQWCPELKDVSEKSIFASADLGIKRYPKRIVDHAKARIAAIAVFKTAFQKK